MPGKRNILSPLDKFRQLITSGDGTQLILQSQPHIQSTISQTTPTAHECILSSRTALQSPLHQTTLAHLRFTHHEERYPRTALQSPLRMAHPDPLRCNPSTLHAKPAPPTLSLLSPVSPISHLDTDKAEHSGALESPLSPLLYSPTEMQCLAEENVADEGSDNSARECVPQMSHLSRSSVYDFQRGSRPQEKKGMEVVEGKPF